MRTGISDACKTLRFGTSNMLKILVSCEKGPHEELAAFPARPGTIQGHTLRPHLFNVPWEVLATAI